ncbi:hypothetical protein [Motilimonas eburnea]|uniref:hypothetical protein n=1 Tax=Motilimonas eburnea TaxID=1737488 RepID=UPI001E4A89AC|nr:hypothetical protein [Motilimonas eburnea]MCE2571979.1 hypothetical protein [Motilimonas eburnea]
MLLGIFSIAGKLPRLFNRIDGRHIQALPVQAHATKERIQGLCQSVFLALCVALLSGCQQEVTQAVASTETKANFDLADIDNQGLANGVTLDFEFCLANQEALINEVKALYPQLQVMKASRGRIGCEVDSNGQGSQVLVIGNTGVDNYRAHFNELLLHPSIVRIERTYWE